MVQKYISTDLSPTPRREKLWHQNFPSSIIHTKINLNYCLIYIFLGFVPYKFLQFFNIRNIESIREKKIRPQANKCRQIYWDTVQEQNPL